MKHTHPMLLSEILSRALENSEMEKRLLEQRAIEAWPLVVGTNLAAGTGRPYVNKGLMTVRIPSAALRQELSMLRSVLIEKLNKAVGAENVIKELRFIS